MRFISFLIVLLSGIQLSAQQPEVVITTGHTDQVNCLAFHPKGDILVSGGNDKLIKLWDIKTAKEIRTISGNDGRLEHISFSPSGAYIAAVLNSNQVKIYTTKTGALVHLIENASSYEDVEFFGDDNKLLYVSDDHKIVLLNIQTKSVEWELPLDLNTKIKAIDNYTKLLTYTVKGEIKVLSLPDGKELSSYKLYQGEDIPQAALPIKLSNNGNLISLVLYNNKIHLFDWKQEKVVHTITDHMIPNNLVKGTAIKDNYLLSADANRNVIVTDIVSKKKVNKFQLTFFYPSCIEAHPEKDIIVVGDMKKILFCNLSDGKMVKTYDSKTNRIINMAYDQQGKYLATASDDISIKLWNLKENKIEKSLMGFFPLAFTNDGKHLISMYNNIGLAIWDPEKGEKIAELNTEMELIQNLSLSKDGKYLAGGGFLGILKIWDLQSNKLIKKFTGHVGGIYGTAFSPDGKLIASGGMDQTIKVWDIESGKELKSIKDHEIIVSSVAFSPDGKFLISASWDKKIKIWNTVDWSLQQTLEGHVNMITDISISSDGKYLASASGNNSVWKADNSVMVWEMASGKMVCRLENPTGAINRVIFEKGTDLLYTCSEDGAAKIWNFKECKQLAGLIAANTSDYLIYTPDNYYTCSKDALNGISFRIEDKIYAFEQFDIRLNRPDLIAQRLGKTPTNLINAYNYVYKKRLKKMGFTEEQFSNDFHIPQLKINTEKIPFVTKEDKVKFTANMYDDLYKLDRLMVYNNNVPINGLNGIDLKSLNTSKTTYDTETELIIGKNKITVSCINEKGVESMIESFEVIKDSKVEEASGNLYVISIGVSEYSDKRYNLKYAAKDAKDVALGLTENKMLYQNCYTKLLNDKEVTKEKISELKEFLKTTGVEDVVVVFIAGHGVLDEKMDYYYCTYDVNFDQPAMRGLPYEELETLLNNVKALKKILFMDTCHSGEIDKEEMKKSTEAQTEVSNVAFRAVGEAVEVKNPFGVGNSIQLTESIFSNLRKGTGTTVISSAGGAELAMESDLWKNGLFTYCLLNGLKAKAADKDYNNEIYVSELQKFVFDEVKKLSQGRQQPTSRAQNLEMDYRLR